jgi:phage head maturation protease
MKGFRLARKRIEISVGEPVRIIRELQELSQNQLLSLPASLKRRYRRSKTTACALASSGQKFSLGR